MPGTDDNDDVGGTLIGDGVLNVVAESGAVKTEREKNCTPFTDKKFHFQTRL